MVGGISKKKRACFPASSPLVVQLSLYCMRSALLAHLLREREAAQAAAPPVLLRCHLTLAAAMTVSMSVIGFNPDVCS